MIKSFKHKGLKALHNKGDASGVKAEHVVRLRRLLSLLDVAAVPADLDRPGYRLHTLPGSRLVGGGLITALAATLERAASGLVESQRPPDPAWVRLSVMRC